LQVCAPIGHHADGTQEALSNPHLLVVQQWDTVLLSVDYCMCRQLLHWLD